MFTEPPVIQSSRICPISRAIPAVAFPPPMTSTLLNSESLKESSPISSAFLRTFTLFPRILRGSAARSASLSASPRTRRDEDPSCLTRTRQECCGWPLFFRLRVEGVKLKSSQETFYLGIFHSRTTCSNLSWTIVVSLGSVGETTRGVGLRGFKSHRPPPRSLTKW